MSSRRGIGGADRDRTDDPLLAKQVLSQLSYSPDRAPACRSPEHFHIHRHTFDDYTGTPTQQVVGLVGFEPTTPRLSSVCSNQLSYRPAHAQTVDKLWTLHPHLETSRSRKEVIQPHLPVRLPCYDFTPVMKLTVVSAPLAVRQPASGEPHSHGVTGGVYKTRERIHRDMLIRDY